LFVFSENKKYFSATSQMFADKAGNLCRLIINRILETYFTLDETIVVHFDFSVGFAVALKSLEITRNELTQSKGVIEKLSAELNGMSYEIN
jgi:hypothetical protein